MPRVVPRRVAVILQLDIEYGRGILRGIGKFFRQRREITVIKFMKSGEIDRAGLTRLGIDGIIAKVSTRAEERMLGELGVPVVNVSGQLAAPTLPTVNTDDVEVGRIAFLHLRSRGCRQMAFVGSRHHAASCLRDETLATLCHQVGMPPVLQHYLPYLEQERSFQERYRDRLEAWVGTLPLGTGVFCFTDRIALEVDHACARLGKRVPEDVAILGIGNDATRLDFTHVETSSVELNTGQIGFLAAKTLYDLMHGHRNWPSPPILVPPLKVAVRPSTDLSATGDKIISRAMEYIQGNRGRVLYVSEVARKMGVSRRALELRFRRVLGSSVYAEVQRLHLEHGVELLADADLTLAEVAQAAGFPNAQRFSALFRRKFGMPPSKFRRCHRGSNVD